MPAVIDGSFDHPELLIQEIGPIVGGGEHSFVSGHSFAKLRYTCSVSYQMVTMEMSTANKRLKTLTGTYESL